MDNGYDENSNPFANVSDEYAKKREEALKKQKQKKISARARQVRKVCFHVLILLVTFIKSFKKFFFVIC